jgi:DNA-binding beta-propeller fold protein YncE
VASTVSVYSVGQPGCLSCTVGALTPTLASPVALATGSNADSLAIDPTGTYAYVSNQFLNTIQVFTISTVDGSLSANSVFASLPTGGNPHEITVGGNYLYVPNSASASSTIWQLSIGAGGALTLVNTTQLATGTGPSDVAVDASGQYAYATDRGFSPTYGTTISQYLIGAGGVLAPLGTPTVAAGIQPAWIVTSVGY